MRPSDQSEQPAYAVVVGLDCMTGLQTARILANRGIPVIGVAADLAHHCCRTRVCEQRLSADISGPGLIGALGTLGARLARKAVLFPCTDTSVLLISRNRNWLRTWYHVLLPDAEVVEMLMDKVRFCRFAQEEGLPIPRTALLHERGDAEREAGEMTYPCILKPPLKTPTWEANSRAKVHKVRSPEELLQTYDRCAPWAEMLIAQEWVEGTDSDLYSCNCYFGADGKPLVTFVARKLRQWPPETGTSCLGEECRNDEVLAVTVQLFERVHYHGLGYVEMKRDRRTGRQYIIEPNIGRPTGRSAIAERGGVDLLYTAYCDAVGWPLPANREQKYLGVKWMYLRRDIQSAFHYWRRGELTLREWVRSIRGPKMDALFSWSDPVPFWADLLSLRRLAAAFRGRSARSTTDAAARPASAMPDKATPARRAR